MPRTSKLLVLEDEPMIALDIEDTLSDGGYSDITILRSCHEALNYLNHERPDAVLLDVSLADGVCHAVAGRLHRQGIPFVIYSGLQPETERYGDTFGKGEWLMKPAHPEDLLAAVASCFDVTKKP